MALKRTEVITAIAASLLDAASVFGEPDSDELKSAVGRHLDLALAELGRVKALLAADTLTIVADQADYPAPADALSFVSCEWADRNALREPWSPLALTLVPLPSLVRVANAPTWRFSPAPDACAITALGTAYPYTYRAAHRLTETETDATFPPSTLPLVIVRAQAAAMSDLAIRNAHKPVQLRDGLYSQTRNGTPAGIADQLLKMWEQMTRDSSQLYGVWQ